MIVDQFTFLGCTVRLKDVSEPDCRRESVEQLIDGVWVEVITAALDWSVEFSAHLIAEKDKEIAALTAEINRLDRDIANIAIPNPPTRGVVEAVVDTMITNEGIYIAGDIRRPNASVVIASRRGKLIAFTPDQVLSRDGFLPTFIVRAGPFK